MQKKRALHQVSSNMVSNKAMMIQNKHKKITPESGIQPQRDVEMKKERKTTFSDLPWDIVEVILDYVNLNAINDVTKIRYYKILRLVNRVLCRKINRRRKSLIFQDRTITERCFATLLERATRNLKHFGIFSNLAIIKKTTFDKFMPQMIGLQRLELSRCNNFIGETGVKRILVSCKRTLQYLALPYQNKAFDISVGATISSMYNLQTLYLGTQGAVRFNRQTSVPQTEMVDHHKYSL